MKIVAVVDTSGYNARYLVEVTDQELGAVVNGKKWDRLRLNVGDQVDINGVFETVVGIRGMREEAASLAASLRKLADMAERSVDAFVVRHQQVADASREPCDGGGG